MQVLIQFAQAHADFRISELLSVACNFGFMVVLPTNIDVNRPFMTVTLQEENHARLIAERCILVKYAPLSCEH